jgi:vitamin B12 transporter
MKTSARMQRLRPRGVALACIAFFYSHTSTAQTELELKEVVVTANRTGQLLTEALPHTTVITSQDIVRSQAVDVGQLLQREAGVQITQSGGRGTAASLFIRGASATQVLVLIDGVPITKQDASGAVSLEHLMLEQVERIEVVRGNVSAIYGTGAVGGVVQIFTKQGRGKPSAQITAEVGSRDSSKFALAVQGSFGEEGATRLSAGLGTNSTDGFSAINTDDRPAASPDKDGYKNRNASFALSQQVAKGHTIGLRASQSKGRFDFDSIFDTPVDIHTGRTDIQTVTVFADNQFTRNWNSKLSWSDSRDDNRNRYQTSFPFNDRYISRNRVLNWTNAIELAPDWQLSAGLEQQRQGVDTDDGFGGFYNESRRVNALFAGVQGQVGSHALQLNVRRDRVGVKNASSRTETTGYLGYGYSITPHWKVLANASTAFNIPPLGYLYAPFFGNPDLKPEKARSRELGVQWTQGAHVMRATAFRTRSRDLFAYDFTTFRFENVDRSKNSGLEVSYSAQLGDTGIKASLTRQNPKNEVTGEVLARRAKDLASVSIDQALGAWRLGADARYSGSRKDGANVLGSYVVGDVSARYAFTKELQAYGRIENVGNVRYQTVYGYNQVPRSVFVGLSWTPTF